MLLVTGLMVPAAGSPSTPTSPDDGWRVATSRDGLSTLTWTAPHRLPITSDRPEVVDARGRSLGAAVVAEDGRSVQVTVTGAVPDPSTLDVVLSGDRIDEPGTDGTEAGSGESGSGAAARRRLAADPATPGPHQIRSEDYVLAPITLDGLAEPVEMVGHVVEPVRSAATGPRPLVVFLHGRHEFCYAPEGSSADTWTWPCRGGAVDVPSHLGFDYLQRLLASQGHTTVSIRANGINAQDDALPDAGAGARADLVDAHLAHWAGLAAAHRVDLDRVVLVGHSRGGEGVNRLATRTQLTAPHTVVGQVLLAPTDFGSQSTPYVPTVTVLPHCDGDVSDLQGQRFVDFGRDLSGADTALKSAVLMIGANHNWFNTEWTPGLSDAPSSDDWFGRKKAYCGRQHAERLSASEQRAAASALVAGAVRLFADGQQEFAPLFDGSPATAASMGRAITHSAAVGGGRELRRPGHDMNPRAGATADARFCRAVVSARRKAGVCGQGIDGPSPNWPGLEERLPERTDLEVTWQRRGQRVTLDLGTSLDLSTRRLDLRTTIDPTQRDLGLGFRLHDASGATSALLPATIAGLGPLPGGSVHARHWAQTVSVASEHAADIDRTRVTAIELVAATELGRIWIHDVAATPATLAPVPAVRLPVIDFGRTRVAEGGGAGRGTAQLPFTVHGTVSEPATVQVVVARPYGARLDVVVAPGTTEGAVAVEFPRNHTYDDTPVVIHTTAVATSAATTGAYVGRVRVVDDEPAPTVRLRAKRRQVREGGVIRLMVRLTAPVTDHRLYTWRFVRGRAPSAQVGDLAAGWRRRWGLDDPAVSLPRSGHFGTVLLEPGRRRAVITIPTTRDGVREGAEHAAVLVRGPGLRARAAVRIADAVGRR